MSVGIDFTCSELLVIQSKAEALFSDAQRQADVTPFAEAAVAVLENQTATFTELKDSDKDRTVKVTWVQSCDMEVTACTDQCVIPVNPTGSFCEDYTMDICNEVAFSVTENVFRTSTLSKDEVVARMMAEAMKAADEYWAAQVVAKLTNYAGTNALTSPYTVAGNQTEIPAASMNASLNGYLALAMAVNKMKNMYMLSGQSLYLPNWNAAMEQGNSDGKGNANKMNTFKKYFDLFNVDTVAGEPSIFLVNPSALAMVTKVRYPNSVPVWYEGARQWRYSVASKTLPGVRYEVHYAPGCSDNDLTWAWRLIMRGGIFQNPLGCTPTRTGVLWFVCAA